MRFAAHGMGSIERDIENPAGSQMLYPARFRVR